MKRMRRYVASARGRTDPRRTPLSFTLPMLAFFAMVLGQFMILAAEESLTPEHVLPRVWQAMFLAGLLSIVLARRRL